MLRVNRLCPKGSIVRITRKNLKKDDGYMKCL